MNFETNVTNVIKIGWSQLSLLLRARLLKSEIIRKQICVHFIGIYMRCFYNKINNMIAKSLSDVLQSYCLMLEHKKSSNCMHKDTYRIFICILKMIAITAYFFLHHHIDTYYFLNSSTTPLNIHITHHENFFFCQQFLHSITLLAFTFNSQLSPSKPQNLLWI